MGEQVNGRPLPGAEEIRLQEDERRTKGYYTLEEVAESLRGQLGWSEAQRETFLRESLLPAAQDGRVPVLHPHTLLPYRPEVFRTFYELTTPALVNKWLHSDGLPYRWRELPPAAGPMSPEAEALAEEVCNGGPVDWAALAQYSNLTPMQAARAAHRIDPFKWRDPERYAQGPLPPDLLERIGRLEQLLRGKAAEWSLASLVGVLGDRAPLGMRQAVEAAGSAPGSSGEPRPQAAHTSKRQALPEWTDERIAEAERRTVEVRRVFDVMAEADRVSRLLDAMAVVSEHAKPQELNRPGSHAAPETAPAPTVRRNSTKARRRNALDPIIDRLLAEAADPMDHAAVWVALLALADGKAKPAPLLGIADGQVQYLGDDGEAAFIKRKPFMQRLKNRTASDR